MAAGSIGNDLSTYQLPSTILQLNSKISMNTTVPLGPKIE